MAFFSYTHLPRLLKMNVRKHPHSAVVIYDKMLRIMCCEKSHNVRVVGIVAPLKIHIALRLIGIKIIFFSEAAEIGRVGTRKPKLCSARLYGEIVRYHKNRVGSYIDIVKYDISTLLCHILIGRSTYFIATIIVIPSSDAEFKRLISRNAFLGHVALSLVIIYKQKSAVELLIVS